MKIVMAGAGGVGGYIGVRLAEAGHEIAWMVRGRTRDALRERGIRLQSPSGEVRLGPQLAGDDAAVLAEGFGAADALIVTVKLYDLAALAPRLAPLAGPGTLVLPLQNGVEAYSILSESLPQTTVLKGTLSIKSAVRDPGEILCKSDFCKVRFGGAEGPSIQALLGALNSGRAMSGTLSPDIDVDLWNKFVMLASFSAVSCMARANIGQVLDDARARGLLIDAALEAAAVGRALGIVLANDIPAMVDAQTRDMPREGKPSMLEDLDAGRRLELDYLSGAVVRLGAKAGVPTPIHAIAQRALAMHAGGADPK